MRDVAILVDGGFYLKRYKKQIDVKQVAKGLLTHCLKHIHNQSLQDMFKSFDIDKAFNFFGVHFRTGLADSNDCTNAILLGRF
jgi:hypothetical protein